MSKIKLCRSCNIELTDENRYWPKNGHSIGKICKDCHKRDRVLRYKNLNISPRSLVKIYHSGELKFASFEEKRCFLIDRKCQTAGAPIVNSYSSRVGQQTEHLVEDEDPETGAKSRYYEVTLCKECGGIVRFDEHGFKVCIVCGLFSSNYTLDNDFEIRQASYNIPQRNYYNRAGQERIGQSESDAPISGSISPGT